MDAKANHFFLKFTQKSQIFHFSDTPKNAAAISIAEQKPTKGDNNDVTNFWRIQPQTEASARLPDFTPTTAHGHAAILPQPTTTAKFCQR